VNELSESICIFDDIDVISEKKITLPENPTSLGCGNNFQGGHSGITKDGLCQVAVRGKSLGYCLFDLVRPGFLAVLAELNPESPLDRQSFAVN
jgi:hypothetical protein